MVAKDLRDFDAPLLFGARGVALIGIEHAERNAFAQPVVAPQVDVGQFFAFVNPNDSPIRQGANGELAAQLIKVFRAVGELEFHGVERFLQGGDFGLELLLLLADSLIFIGLFLL
jgi:hypothetical protein